MQELKPEAVWRKKFSEALRKRRHERGYQSAYAFFHENRGQKYFGFSYNHYLRIERGIRLPDQPGLRRILAAFGAPLALYRERQELLFLYVKALLNGDPLFDPVLADPVASGSAGSDKATPEEAILRSASRAKWGEIPLMSEKQLETITSDADIYWIFIWLVTTGLKRTSAELAKDLSCPEPRLIAPLARLVDQKLIEQTKAGAYFSPHFETDLSNPGSSMTHQRTLWISEQILGKIRPGGNHSHSHIYLAVEDDETMGTLTALMREAIHRANLLRRKVPASKGHLVSVETRVGRLIPIPD